MKKKKTHELAQRLLVTAVILAIYMAGRSVLLYDIDSAAYQLEELNSQNIITSMVSGDRYQYTIFALGIMPYITANLIIWVATSIMGAEFKSRISPQRMERASMLLMLIVAAISAVSRAGGLVFQETYFDVRILKLIAVIELILGAVIIHKMADVNKDHGIAAQTPIILVNIADNLFATLQKFSWQALLWPLLLCLVMAAVVLLMENCIRRIPVQRVSIHNEYADKSYIAMKLDPIGVMPVMFAASFFMIPQMIIRLLLLIWKDASFLQLAEQRLNLNDIVGVCVYVSIIFLLNILFSFITIAPGDMAEQLQKMGDSIVGVYAGRKTKRYLRNKLLLLTLCSGCILCVMMGVSLGFALSGAISPELAMLPATAMILTGLTCTLYREIVTYKKFDSYSFFI